MTPTVPPLASSFYEAAEGNDEAVEVLRCAADLCAREHRGFPDPARRNSIIGLAALVLGATHFSTCLAQLWASDVATWATLETANGTLTEEVPEVEVYLEAALRLEGGPDAGDPYSERGE